MADSRCHTALVFEIVRAVTTVAYHQCNIRPWYSSVASDTGPHVSCCLEDERHPAEPSCPEEVDVQHRIREVEPGCNMVKQGFQDRRPLPLLNHCGEANCGEANCGERVMKVPTPLRQSRASIPNTIQCSRQRSAKQSLSTSSASDCYLLSVRNRMLPSRRQADAGHAARLRRISRSDLFHVNTRHSFGAFSWLECRFLDSDNSLSRTARPIRRGIDDAMWCQVFLSIAQSHERSVILSHQSGRKGSTGCRFSSDASQQSVAICLR